MTIKIIIWRYGIIEGRGIEPKPLWRWIFDSFRLIFEIMVQKCRDFWLIGEFLNSREIYKNGKSLQFSMFFSQISPKPIKYLQKLEKLSKNLQCHQFNSQIHHKNYSRVPNFSTISPKSHHKNIENEKFEKNQNSCDSLWSRFNSHNFTPFKLKHTNVFIKSHFFHGKR